MVDILGAPGNDTFTYTVGDGRNSYNGADGSDTQIVNGSAGPESYNINPISNGYIGFNIQSGAGLNTPATDASYTLRDVNVENLVVNLGDGGNSVVIGGDLGSVGVTGVTVNGGANDDVLDASMITGGSGPPTIQRVSVDDAGNQGLEPAFGASISNDGRYVVYVGRANIFTPGGEPSLGQSIYLYDRNTQTVDLISVDANGNPALGITSGRPVISADDRYIAFYSNSATLVPGDPRPVQGLQDAFVYDRNTKTTERISVSDTGQLGNGDTGGNGNDPSISSDGRYISFESSASNLVPGDTNGNTDVFVYDRIMHTIERVSVTDAGNQGNNESEHPSISADGRYVAFASYASNLVPGDTNGISDVFVYDRSTHTVQLISVNDAGRQGNSFSEDPSISDGHYVTFTSNATNLVAGDDHGQRQIFVYDRDTARNPMRLPE